MQRSDYAFAPLAFGDYELAVMRGTMPGYSSPMHGATNYDALIAVMREADIDPRLPLAFTWAEGHQMSDPNLVAARVNNPGGVKYVGAAGTTDSGIPADTGGTYAAYPDLAAYYRDWVRVMNNSIIGPDFRSGNLVGAVEHYTNGPGSGGNKITKFLEYQQAYPPGGDVTTGIPADKIADEALRHLNEKRSGAYDTLNGDHYWCNPATNDFWCESFVERVHEHCGVSVVPRETAGDKGRALQAQGYMHVGATNAPRGSVISLDERYWPAGGHTAIALGDGTMVGTCAPEGIGIRPIPYNSPGYMGWSTYPGVSLSTPPAPAPTPVPPPGPTVSGGFKTLWLDNPAVGEPLTGEVQGMCILPDGTRHQRTVQFFGGAIFVYDPARTPTCFVAPLSWIIAPV